MNAVVMPAVRISSSTSLALKDRTAMLVTPALNPWVAHHSPPMCEPEIPMRLLSSGRQSIQSSPEEPGRVLLVAHDAVLAVLFNESKNEAVQRCG